MSKNVILFSFREKIGMCGFEKSFSVWQKDIDETRNKASNYTRKQLFEEFVDSFSFSPFRTL